MAAIHSATADIRRGKKIERKKKKESTGQKYNVRIYATQGGHKNDRIQNRIMQLSFVDHKHVPFSSHVTFESRQILLSTISRQLTTPFLYQKCYQKTAATHVKHLPMET